MNDNVAGVPDRNPAAAIEIHAAEVTRLAEEIVRLFKAKASRAEIDRWLNSMNESSARLRAVGGMVLNDDEKRRLDAATESLDHFITRTRQLLARDRGPTES